MINKDKHAETCTEIMQLMHSKDIPFEDTFTIIGSLLSFICATIFFCNKENHKDVAFVLKNALVPIFSKQFEFISAMTKILEENPESATTPVELVSAAVEACMDE